jgi:hypothetical protein
MEGQDKRGKDPGTVQPQYELCGGAPCIRSKSFGEDLTDSRDLDGERWQLV